MLLSSTREIDTKKMLGLKTLNQGQEPNTLKIMLGILYQRTFHRLHHYHHHFAE